MQKRMSDEHLEQLLDRVGPDPWYIGMHGSVVRHKPAEAMSKTELWYGGVVVCETVTGSEAQLISNAPEIARELVERRRRDRTEKHHAMMMHNGLMAVMLIVLAAFDAPGPGASLLERSVGPILFCFSMLFTLMACIDGGAVDKIKAGRK